MCAYYLYLILFLQLLVLVCREWTAGLLAPSYNVYAQQIICVSPDVCQSTGVLLDDAAILCVQTFLRTQEVLTGQICEAKTAFSFCIL